MLALFAILVGLLAAWLLITVVKNTPVHHQERMSALTLIVAAGVYWVLALFGGSLNWLLIETVGMLIFGAFAIAGFKVSPKWIALGWVLHIGWDVLLHDGTTTPWVPEWYPPLCVGFDALVAAYLFRLVYKTSLRET